MKINSLKLHPVSVKRRYATVIASEGGKPKRKVTRSFFYFVEMATDRGVTGWGEISDVEPQDLPKDAGEFAALLNDFMRGRSAYAVQRMHREFREHFDVENSSLAGYAECALDMAMYDAQAKAAKQPVFNLLGGAMRKDVVISWVAYIREDLNLIREEIKEKTAAGFRAFKLKVGVDIDLDEERLAVARETAGKEVSIKIDANAGWSVEQAPKNIRRLNKFNLAGVETPVPREDPSDIAAVRKQVDVPILEHVGSLEYGLALVKSEAVDVFNISTPGAGGLWPARRLVALAEAAGIGVLLGSTVELGPGTLAQLHLAATTPNLELPSDLIGPGMYVDDVLNKPLAYKAGRLEVPRGIGLGGDVDAAALKRLRF